MDVGKKEYSVIVYSEFEACSSFSDVLRKVNQFIGASVAINFDQGWYRGVLGSRRTEANCFIDTFKVDFNSFSSVFFEFKMER